MFEEMIKNSEDFYKEVCIIALWTSVLISWIIFADF
jgi:hypothetical protein